MAFENILVECKGRIQYITINRESKLNALNKATLAELHIALTDGFSNNQIGGLIITGAGQKAFVAGADISEFASFDAAAGRALARVRLASRIRVSREANSESEGRSRPG